MYKVGFDEVRERVNAGSRYLRSCFNCRYCYEADGEDEELCHNDNVLEFDIVVEENRIYCHLWKL